MATTSPDNIPYVGPTQYSEPADFPAIDEDQAQAIQTLIATLRSQIAAITSNTTGGAVCPVGTIIAYGGTSAPTGWHLCDGTAHGSAALTAVLGSASAPDLRNRFIVGAGSSYARGNTGGADSVTLTAAQSGLQAHTHTTSVGGVSSDHSHWIDPPAVYVDPQNQGHTHSGTTGTMNQNWSHSHGAGSNTAQLAGYNGVNQDQIHHYQATNVWDYRSFAYASIWVSATDINHTHSFGTGDISQGHQHYLDMGGFSSGGISANHTHGVTVNANATASATSSHENRPPYYALVYIIKK